MVCVITAHTSPRCSASCLLPYHSWEYGPRGIAARPGYFEPRERKLWGRFTGSLICGRTEFVTPPKVESSVSKLIELDVIIQRAGPPVRHPSRRLRAIPRNNLL